MGRIGWVVAAVLASGCAGDKGSTTTEESCDTCAANGQLCQVYADGEPGDWPETCVAMPAECEVDSPCDVNECAAAMYDTCDAGYIGQARSCYGDSVVVTCSPLTTPSR